MKHSVFSSCVAVAGAAVFAVFATAGTYYVSPDGLHEHPFDTMEKAAKTLAAAVNAVPAAGSGTVIVDRGHYILDDNTLRVDNKTVVITSLWGAAETIFDGDGKTATWGSALRTGNGGNITLHGLTMTNCVRAFQITENAIGSVVECVFVDNQALSGAAIFMGNATLSVSRSVFRGNTVTTTTYGGGGLYAYNEHAHIRIEDSEFYENHSNGTGGAIFVGESTNTIIRNTVVSNNTAAGQAAGIHGFIASVVVDGCRIVDNTGGVNGGAAVGIRAYNSLFARNSATGSGGAAINSHLFNCYVVSNTANTHGGGFSGGSAYSTLFGHNTAGSQGGGAYGARLYNCTVVNNTADTGGGISSCHSVNTIAYFNKHTGIYAISSNRWAWDSASYTNVITAPYVADGRPWVDSMTDDPMLDAEFKPRKGSPAINAGLYQAWMDDAVDIAGRPRILQGAVDIGAYEYAPSATVIIVR